MTDNTQELDEIFNDDYFDVKVAKQQILRWVESLIGDDEKLYDPPFATSKAKASRNALRAEIRNKLKESSNA